MLISVVTVVYNREEVIADAIRSVQSQTYPNVEHVIQDGGSTDRTLEIINSLANSRTVLETGPDLGIYDAINRGILRCKGDVIGLMHSDDEFVDCSVLEKISLAFEDPTIDGVYGDIVYVANDHSGRIIRYWRAGEVSIGKIRRGWMPPHPSLYLRSDVFRKFGLYDDTMRISADYEAMVRWLYRDGVKLRYIPELLVRMRVGGASNGSAIQLLRKTREDFQVIRRYHLGGLGTLIGKNLRKVHQFVSRP